MRPFESKSSFFTAPLSIARCAATAFAFALLVTGVTKNALAAIIDVAPGAVTGSTDGCSLVDAIHAANTNAAAGACAAGDDAHDGGDSIRLAAGVYTLTTADNYWYGPNGLPAIDSKISIFGDPDGSIIERDTGASPFRLLYVGGGQSLAAYNPPAGLTKLPGPGTLRLVRLTLRNGLAEGGDGRFSGGGLGAGGAIYNQGALILEGVLLTDNAAKGGDGGVGELVGGGGGMGGDGGMGGEADQYGGGFNPGGSFPDGADRGEFGNGGAPGVGGDNYGGDGGVGGGGGSGHWAGGSGGFGGGGGPADDLAGNGGFGGGGGNSVQMPTFGTGGFGGGDGGHRIGGGGGGLGGAVFNEGGDLQALNSTFTGNSARGGIATPIVPDYDGSGFGGAVFNLNGEVVIRYSTLAGNNVSGRVAAGGAVYNLFEAAPGSPAADAAAAATMTVDSSILSGSRNGATVVSDCENGTSASASFTSGYDVVETPGSCIFDDNDQAADPQLGVLSDNGGPTRTMAIAATSVAVDMGNTGTPTPLDQRVQARDNLPDVGAYELNALPTLPATPSTPLQDMRVAADGPPVSQDFTLSLDSHSVYDLLVVTARSSNQTVLPSDHLVIDPDCGKGAAHYTCRLTVTPAGQGGTVTVTLVATDQFGLSASTSFLLDLDTRPLAIDQSLSTVAGVTFSGSLPALDIDGDPLTFSIDTPPAHGEAVVTDAAAGVFTYTPAAGYSGADSFTFIANDGLTNSAAATVTIDVNAPPADDDAPPADDDTPPSGDDTPPADDNPPADDDNPPSGDDTPPADDDNPPSGDDTPPADNDNPPVGDGDTPPDRSPPPARSGGGGLGPLALCILLVLGFGRRGTCTRGNRRAPTQAKRLLTHRD